MSSHPAVVVVAYNRPHSLTRLLNSLSLADYEEGYPDLIISVDFSDDFTDEVGQIAEAFNWNGQKEVIIQPKNLGLKKHVLRCGDLTKRYDSIIMLEDDLIVSPKFYRFAVETLSLVQNSQEVSQVALYQATFNEAAMVPFEALKSSSDFFLMQVPCSWGQIWTNNQWESFKNWYLENESDFKYNTLPKGIREWSDKSWKKPYFIYLKETHKYVLYPYVSYSMNINEEGTNVSQKDFIYSNSLALGLVDRPLVLRTDVPKYDEAFMIDSDYLYRKLSSHELQRVQIDFFGSKLHMMADEDLVLTLLPAKNTLISFGLDLKPIELNVICRIEGEEIKLVKKKDIVSNRLTSDVMAYLYPIPKWYYPYFQEPLKDRIIKTFQFLIKKN
ncbi:glycosyltransferase [Mangrovimonas sp. AS39]|uniref:glycosyltransferase n=1 Tax=Mangrovimonas futianensis TaxID=2895523 RepID=UPI001E52A60D|nr:glycosyltransferase [Mangrovimonas futianensis]MCF1190810.1 glycosyltransferase [Mangrovimonas futianensis]MCF1194507.1 glycosyltransferase [Mangrovimonas futianensis]